MMMKLLISGKSNNDGELLPIFGGKVLAGLLALLYLAAFRRLSNDIYKPIKPVLINASVLTTVRYTSLYTVFGY